MLDSSEKWLTITEYSNYKDLSVSTIRRYIKSNRVKYKMEDGKYYIFCPNFREDSFVVDVQEDSHIELEAKIKKLEQENRKLKIETHEMKMLIDLYEAQLGIIPQIQKKNKEIIPELPR